MKRLCLLLAVALTAALPALEGDSYIAPPESLVIDGVPKISAALAETAGRYASFRSASLSDWHPTRHEKIGRAHV